jgi:hypothetical protein
MKSLTSSHNHIIIDLFCTGLKFARRLLTCFWDSFLFIYSNGVSPTSNETDNQAISQALECLQNAAKLANILGTAIRHFLRVIDV